MKKLLLGICFIYSLGGVCFGLDTENPARVVVKLYKLEYVRADEVNIEIHNPSQKSIWIRNACASYLMQKRDAEWIAIRADSSPTRLFYCGFTEIKPNESVNQSINFDWFTHSDILLNAGTYKFRTNYIMSEPLLGRDPTFYSIYSDEFVVNSISSKSEHGKNKHENSY